MSFVLLFPLACGRLVDDRLIDRLDLRGSVVPFESGHLVEPLLGEHLRQRGIGNQGIDRIRQGVHVPIVDFERVVEHFGHAASSGEMPKGSDTEGIT